MALNMRTSQAGLDVIKAFEGFRSSSELLPNGRWIIGYGHLRRAAEGVRVSETEAEAILREYDLPPVERFVMRCVLAPMTQNEFDALVSLAFNIGPKAFASSDVVAEMNGGNRLDAAQAFDQWRRARIGGRVQIVDALVRRRAAEKALFLNAPGRLLVASSRLYRAMHDSEALPPPPEAREILVEHRPAPEIRHIEADAKMPETLATATEEAAASVRQQMVRILGETPDPETKVSQQTDGATPEEITAAISELAGASDSDRARKSVWPQHQDLPRSAPYQDQPDRDRNPIQMEHALLTPAEDATIIDDLEQIEVSQESIEQAVQYNQRAFPESETNRLLSALPFGLLGVIGFILAVYGTAHHFGAENADYSIDRSLSGFFPFFLVVLGALLFLSMTYYFLRALVSDD